MEVVADWSQAKIGYTAFQVRESSGLVADWSQAKIGYTTDRRKPFFRWLRIGLRPRLVTLPSDVKLILVPVADWSQAKIGYTCARN